MASQDFTLSYTINELLTWIDHGEGQLGATSTIFADITTLEQYGATSTIFADITTFEQYGATSTISGVQSLPSPIFADILHYSQEGLFKTNIIVLPDNGIVRGTAGVQNWIKKGNRIEVLVCELDVDLKSNNSNALIINGNSGSGLLYELPINAQQGIVYTIVNTSTSGTIKVKGQTDLIFAPNRLVSEIDIDSIGAKLRLQSDGNNRWTILNQQNTSSGILNPDIFGGLSLHLDATNSNSITLGVSPDVSQWDDLSGSGNHVSQGVGANRPHDGADINGVNAIEFDGVAHYLKNSVAGGVFNGVNGDFYCVIEPNVDNIFQYVMTSADESVNNAFMILGLRDTDLFQIAQNNGGSTNSVVSTNTLSSGVPYIVRCSSDGSSYSMEIQGQSESVTVLFGSDNGNWFGDVSGRDNFIVGAIERLVGVETFFNGKIGEIIYYDGKVLSSADSTILTNSLKDKWGIT